jgi:MoaA/NifB/PqqE/SkfB family radical SAM enzyme
MTQSWFSQFWRKRKKIERWSVLQIEVTSRCLLHCSFCPNKTLGKQWLYGDLPIEVYRDYIVPHLGQFDLAYLQGWGEPLLHPQIWEMVRLAKAERCRVGFTTCGSPKVLNEKNCARVLDEGVDILSVSFAGATREMHESLRVGSSFDALCATVAWLAKERDARRSTLNLELHFLMMRSNIHELPAFVRLAQALGANQIVATNLAYTPTLEMDAWRVFADSPELIHQDAVAEAIDEAQRLKIEFNAYPLKLNTNVLECDAKPTNTAFVNHRGDVSPCVYLGMPVRDQAPRVFEGKDHALLPMTFGNVRDGLIEAMQSRERREFIKPIRARKKAGLTALTFALEAGDPESFKLPPPPVACRACPKMYGV